MARMLCLCAWRLRTDVAEALLAHESMLPVDRMLLSHLQMTAAVTASLMYTSQLQVGLCGCAHQGLLAKDDMLLLDVRCRKDALAFATPRVQAYFYARAGALHQLLKVCLRNRVVGRTQQLLYGYS